jgi:single-strand DNA-binding protein
MADLSNYSFTGRLGADAQIKTTPNGKTYMEMSVAVSTGYGDYKNTLWIKAKQWGDRVSNIVDIFKKGVLVAASGEPKLNEWDGKDGTHHATLEVTCTNIQILSSKKDSGGSEEHNAFGPSSSTNQEDIAF